MKREPNERDRRRFQQVISKLNLARYPNYAYLESIVTHCRTTNNNERQDL